MTKLQFRKLLLTSIGVALLAAVVDFAAPSLVGDSLRKAQEVHDESVSFSRLLLALLVGLAGLVTSLVGMYGLYHFRRWAPRTALIGTAISLLACPALGAWVQSGLAVALSFAASYLWGATVLVPLLQPYQSWFAEQSAPKHGDA
jgi:hypothetical protein